MSDKKSLCIAINYLHINLVQKFQRDSLHARNAVFFEIKAWTSYFCIDGIEMAQ